MGYSRFDAQRASPVTMGSGALGRVATSPSISEAGGPPVLLNVGHTLEGQVHPLQLVVTALHPVVHPTRQRQELQNR